MMTVTTGGECSMIDTPTRRVVLGAGVFAAGSLLMADGSVAQAPLAATPACHDGDDATGPPTEGPYFKPSSPERTELFEEGMAGQPIELVGFVLSRACKPLAGALLDFWQADDKGRYDNSGFRLRGHQFTDADGRYRLRSILPALCPGRTLHINVKVQPRDASLLTTHLYFPGEPKNSSDVLFRKDLQMRTAKNAGWLAGRFDFVVG